MNIKSINKLKEIYGDGDGLIIRIDNDQTQVYNKEIEQKIDAGKKWCYIFEGEGYNDVCDLYKALFPNADVDWV